MQYDTYGQVADMGAFSSLQTRGRFPLILGASQKPSGLTRLTTKGCAVVTSGRLQCCLCIMAFSFDSMFIAEVLFYLQIYVLAL